MSPGLAPPLKLNDLDLSCVEAKEVLQEIQSSGDSGDVTGVPVKVKSGTRKRESAKKTDSTNSTKGTSSVNSDIGKTKRTRSSK